MDIYNTLRIPLGEESAQVLMMTIAVVNNPYVELPVSIFANV